MPISAQTLLRHPPATPWRTTGRSPRESAAAGLQRLYGAEQLVASAAQLRLGCSPPTNTRDVPVAVGSGSLATGPGPHAVPTCATASPRICSRGHVSAETSVTSPRCSYVTPAATPQPSPLMVFRELNACSGGGSTPLAATCSLVGVTETIPETPPDSPRCWGSSLAATCRLQQQMQQQQQQQQQQQAGPIMRLASAPTQLHGTNVKQTQLHSINAKETKGKPLPSTPREPCSGGGRDTGSTKTVQSKQQQQQMRHGTPTAMRQPIVTQRLPKRSTTETPSARPSVTRSSRASAEPRTCCQPPCLHTQAMCADAASTKHQIELKTPTVATRATSADALSEASAEISARPTSATRAAIKPSMPSVAVSPQPPTPIELLRLGTPGSPLSPPVPLREIVKDLPVARPQSPRPTLQPDKAAQHSALSPPSPRHDLPVPFNMTARMSAWLPSQELLLDTPAAAAVLEPVTAPSGSKAFSVEIPPPSVLGRPPSPSVPPPAPSLAPFFAGRSEAPVTPRISSRRATTSAASPTPSSPRLCRQGAFKDWQLGPRAPLVTTPRSTPTPRASSVKSDSTCLTPNGQSGSGSAAVLDRCRSSSASQRRRASHSPPWARHSRRVPTPGTPGMQQPRLQQSLSPPWRANALAAAAAVAASAHAAAAAAAAAPAAPASTMRSSPSSARLPSGRKSYCLSLERSSSLGAGAQYKHAAGARKSSKIDLQGDSKESEDGSRRRWKEFRPSAGPIDKVSKAAAPPGRLVQDSEELSKLCVGLQQKLGSMRKQDSLLFL